jgi:hypothetical protein
MSRLLVPLLLAAVPAFAGERSPLARDVDAYLATDGGAPTARPSDTFLSAAAGGGIMGWGSFRLDAWFPSLKGTIDDGSGDSASLSQLGMDSTETTVVPRALLSLGGVGVLFDGYLFKTQGDGTITGTFNFGGIDFVVNENVHTKVDLTNLRAILTVPVVNNDFLRVSLLGGISYYSFDVTVTGETSGTGSVTAPVPVPILGVLGQAKVGPLLLEAEVSGLTFNYGDYNLDYLDMQMSVGFQFLKIVAVRAGYRYVWFNGTIEGYSLDASLDGFFVGASLNF